MTELTLTSGGRVTLTQDLLEHLGVGPGDQLDLELLPNGQVALTAGARTIEPSDATEG